MRTSGAHHSVTQPAAPDAKAETARGEPEREEKAHDHHIYRTEQASCRVPIAAAPDDARRFNLLREGARVLRTVAREPLSEEKTSVQGSYPDVLGGGRMSHAVERIR